MDSCRAVVFSLNWPVRTGALADSPMRTLTPPIVPDVRVVTDDEMRRLSTEVWAGRSKSLTSRRPVLVRKLCAVGAVEAHR